ncbi:MAG: metal-transporting ATPase [Candidatus Latescibacteria bacterium]|nr:metal-transporting ATPase [Candidatus Latescibacterota bacterium]
MRTTFQVKGMCCPGESKPIERRLRGLEGVSEVGFNLVAETVTVEHCLRAEEIVAAIREEGFEARPESRVPDTGSKPQRWRTILTCVGGALTAVGMGLEHAGYPASAFAPVYGTAMLAAGAEVARKGVAGLWRLSFDIHVLMTLAALGAVGIGAWSEGASVLFLFAVAQALERASMDRVRRSVKGLMDLSPTEASVLKGDEEVRTRVEEVEVGTTILVRPGERLALDGRVTSGVSEVDEAPITGESVPVAKSVGDAVFAGTINGTGAMEVEVTRRVEETTLSRIVHLVEEAQVSRAPTQRSVERFARVYTPAVLCGAVAVAVIPPLVMGLPFAVWFYRALVLLVIACPCALVISTPVSIVSALARAAREGVLIKGGAHLETLGRVRAVAFDKTGTLTEGRFGVDEVVSLDGSSPATVLGLAASVEGRSEHRVAQAILDAARRERLPIRPTERFRALAGLGAEAGVGEETYMLGNHRLVEARGVCGPHVEAVLSRVEGDGRTAVVLADRAHVLGVIAVSDRVREEGAEAVRDLRRGGVEHVAMLTGDNEITARAVAGRLGIEDVRAERLPEDKVKEVRDLVARYGVVAMVGDGINDAPALAAASVGVAMGGAGTDAALETADVALMGDDLRRLAWAVRLGRRTLSVIQQNVVFSVGIKAVFMVLAVSGLATLWMAVAADMGASLVVTANGLRLLRKVA